MKGRGNVGGEVSKEGSALDSQMTDANEDGGPG